MPKGDSKGSFVNRSGKGGGMTPGDAWRAYLAFKSGVGSQADLEKRWLRANGGSGETSADLWNTFLNSKGYTVGTLSERKQQYLDRASIS